MSVSAGPIVTIEGCTASQLIGTATIEIASGKLVLRRVEEDTIDALLAFQIGDSFVFPIENDAIVGTTGERSYIFTKKLAAVKPTIAKKPEGDLADIPLNDEKASKDDAVAPDSRLVLRLDMSTTASESDLTAFEKCLVEHGYLEVGIQADADNLARSFLEWAGVKSQDIQSFTKRKALSGPATTDPSTFSSETHSAVSNTAYGTTKIAEATTKVGQTINAGMTSFGAFLGSKLGSLSPAEEGTLKHETTEAAHDGIEAVSIVGTGLAAGAKDVGQSISDSTSKAVDHTYGPNATKIKEEVGTTLQNVGSVGVTAVEQTSAISHGVSIGKGAAMGEAQD